MVIWLNKTECGLLIKQISDHISKTANNELHEDNLTLSQLRCLEFIYESKGEKTPLKKIEAHFNISQPTLAGIVARLTQKGLLITEISDSNARAKTASLTIKGEELFHTFDERREIMENRLLVSLSEDEMVEFYRLLKKVNDGLKNVWIGKTIQILF